MVTGDHKLTGLAIAREVVTAHGGRIDARSTHLYQYLFGFGFRGLNLLDLHDLRLAEFADDYRFHGSEYSRSEKR